MRRIGMILFSVLLFAWVWTGCADNDKVEAFVTPELQVEKSVNCDWKGTPVAVAVKTNQDSWLARVSEEAVEWCDFVPRRDSIIVKPRENYLETERRALIVVTAGGLTDTLEVIQEATADPYCEVSEKDLHFVWQENTLQVVVSTNQTSWNTNLVVTAGSADWCSMRKVENRLVITAERNETSDVRRAEITITAGKAEPVKVTLAQEGKKAPVAGALVFDVTKDFGVSDVYEVWNGDQIMAEICYEYIPDIQSRSRVTVVYPVVDGNADLSRGYVVANGGRVAWNNGTYQYTPGSLSVPAARLVIDGGNLSATVAGNESPATVLPAMMKDGGKNKYRLVKIGMQYWIGENLRTKHYADGSAIGVDYTSKAGAWSLYDDKVTGKGDIETMGLLYNRYVIDRIAPAGWHIPDTVEFRALINYLGGENGVLMRKPDARWSTPCNASNLSGFAAVPCGYRWDTGVPQLGSARDMVAWWAKDDTENQENKEPKGFFCQIYYNKSSSEISSFFETFLYSIRLLKD